jgi:hypothetical protein
LGQWETLSLDHLAWVLDQPAVRDRPTRIILLRDREVRSGVLDAALDEGAGR